MMSGDTTMGGNKKNSHRAFSGITVELASANSAETMAIPNSSALMLSAEFYRISCRINL
jgi:hypothetical protein